jgi:hypothetical protein
MNTDQKARYEMMRQTAKDELDHLDRQLSEEVARAKQKIEDLQKAKKLVKQIYNDACSLLGVSNVVEMQEYGLGDFEKPES